MKLTFPQAYDKIIEAYHKNEIKPFMPEFCFCGTLSPDERWGLEGAPYNETEYPYTREEYGRMEKALFSKIPGIRWKSPANIEASISYLDSLTRSKEYEDILFEAMSAALDELKEIHRERGENVDECIIKKRKLVTA